MRKTLTAFPLKVIAIAAMFINHVANSGLIGYDDSPTFYLIALVVGKLTFPIMAWLLVEGYKHTSNVRRYALRLALFWILSIVPFWLAFYYPATFSAAELVNNVMFTLLAGLLLLIVTDGTQSSGMRVVMVMAFSMVTLYSDWAVIGVLMIYGFYRIEGTYKKVILPLAYTLAFLVFLLGTAAAAYAELGMDTELVIADLIGSFGLILPLPLLLRYNGERGYSPAWVKWGFYIFYPAHLLVLGLLVMVR